MGQFREPLLHLHPLTHRHQNHQLEDWYWLYLLQIHRAIYLHQCLPTGD